jgi:hypothetical protein
MTARFPSSFGKKTPWTFGSNPGEENKEKTNVFVELTDFLENHNDNTYKRSPTRRRQRTDSN